MAGGACSGYPFATMRRPAVLAVLALLPAGVTRAGQEYPRAGSVVRVDVVRSEMVLIPAGNFEMGYSGTVADNEEALEQCRAELGGFDPAYCPDDTSRPFYMFASATPMRSVFLHAYEIDRYEVTVHSYRQCVAAGVCDVAPMLAGDTRYLEDDWPIVGVSWQDAADFCEWQ